MNIEQIDYAKGIQLDTLITAFKLAELGQGFVLARSSLVENHLKTGRLIAPFGSDCFLKASEGFYLAVPEQNRQNKNVKLFTDWLMEQLS